MKKIKIFFLRHVVQEKIRPCFQSPSFNYGVILSTQHSVLSTTESLAERCPENPVRSNQDTVITLPFAAITVSLS